MNCLEFRRQFMAYPNSRDAALLEHLASCQACHQFATRTLKLDRILHQAVQVEIPEGLAARVILRQRMNARFQYRQPWFLALAASVLLGVSLVFGYYHLDRQPTLEQAVLAHIYAELNHLSDQKNITLTSLNAITQPQGIQLKSTPGMINYAGTCPIRKTRGTHLVLAAPNAPVTVLLMPGEPVAGRRMITDTRFQGVILPIHNGSLAIIGEHTDDLKVIERRIMESLIITSS